MRARLVDEYTAQATGYERSWLDLLFDRATIISGETSGGFFNSIWIPARKYDPTTQKLSENYTYYNVGMSTKDIADLYWTEYSGNYLIGRQSDISIDFAYILTRVQAIFKKNLGKYRKLVELEGLEWNPLWNVDGEEIRQLLENSGTTDVQTGEIRSNIGIQYDNKEKTHNVSAYNSNTKTEWTETDVGNGTNVPTGIQRVTEIDGEVTVTDANIGQNDISHADNYTNGTKGSTKYVHNLAKNLNGANEEDYIVDARDTAFGQALKGADKMHVEKLIRHGNIGVTKTTELIEDARRAIAYSLIQQFFDDINEVILVGVWGSRDEIPWYESYAVQPVSLGSRVVNYSRTREMTFDPNGNLVNIVFTDGNVTTSYSAAEIAEEREHYGTDVVPLHETLMYP